MEEQTRSITAWRFQPRPLKRNSADLFHSNSGCAGSEGVSIAPRSRPAFLPRFILLLWDFDTPVFSRAASSVQVSKKERCLALLPPLFGLAARHMQIATMWRATSLLFRPGLPADSRERTQPLTEALRRDGFVVMRGALDQAACRMVRQTLVAELDAEEEWPVEMEDRRVNIPLSSTHIAMSALAKVVRSSASSFLELFGAEGQLRTLSALIGLPEAGTQQIHADMDWDAHTLFCHGLVALQDVRLEMGPTVLYAGTNQRDFHARRRAFERGSLAVDPIEAHAPSYMVLSEGDMVIFDAKIFHHGTANVSTIPRILLSFSILSDRSHSHDLPGYFRLLATPDIADGQFIVQDFLADHGSLGIELHGPQRACARGLARAVVRPSE